MTDRSISVSKYNGTGNDFIVVNAEIPVPDRRAFAIEHCDRETGIDHPETRVGADGVLFLALEDRYSPPRVIMTLVQPDGSVASMCGNGARCAAAWAARKSGASELMIDTQAGTRRAVIDEADHSIRIEMGEPSFEPNHVPAVADAPLINTEIEGLSVTAVNTGVPHAVAFVSDVDAVSLDRLAQPVRTASVFPDGANVTFASPRDDGGYDQRTFERGVEGETKACGTGAVAIAAVARRLGRIAKSGVETIGIHPPGGALEVTLSDCKAFLSGSAIRELSTELPVARPRRIDRDEPRHVDR